MKTPVLLALAAAVLLVSLTSTLFAPRADAAPIVTVAVRGSAYGPILFDGRGYVLYAFTRDPRGRSTCSGACAAAWPLYRSRGTLRAGKGARAGLIGRTRSGQITYAGRPLYYYVGDRRPGQILCQNVFEFGGRWLVVRGNGSLVQPAQVGTTTERMLAGALYRADDPELVGARNRAKRLLVRYASTLGEETGQREEILQELLGEVGAGVWIEPPFHCDYGSNITLGDSVYVNASCVILDCARVEIGAGSLLGPAVQVYAATHPTDAQQRRAGLECAAPIAIGANVWIGGGAIVGPGVTIGENAVIGAGSVVIRDVPTNVVAVGNPCRVIRNSSRPAKPACGTGVH